MSPGNWLAGVVCLAVLCTRPASSAPPAYADAAACAVCHRQVADSYSKTGMSRSFRSVAADTRFTELESGSYDHQPSAEHFVTLRRNDKYYVQRTTSNARGQEANLFAETVDYVIGSGNDAASYLHRTPDNRLIELPVTWYAQNGGHWGMSPGYDRPEHPGFSRTISYRCMFCHNAYPDIAGGAPEVDGASAFPTQLPEGIDCQRCHGPAASHVAAARLGKPLNEIRAAVLNPARLAPARQMEVCMQCHLETTSTQLPGSLMRFERGVFSYRPQEPLADYLLYFDHAPGTGHDDKFEFVSEVYRLRKSACFQASGERLTCTTCHDPHKVATREESLRKTNQVCATCHAAGIARLVSGGGHTAATECASCHMPQRQGVDAIHISVTDHKIQRPGKAPFPTPVVEEDDGNTLPYAGEVVPYYPKVTEPLYAAIAQVGGMANLPAGLTRLESFITDSRPKEAPAYFAMGEALAGAAQAGRSVPFYEQAVKIEPENWRYLYSLGQALQATGRIDQAVAALTRAVSLAPEETNVLDGLGVAYALQGRIPDALKTLRAAVRRNPEDSTAQSNLGQALVRAGDLQNAEAAFREAVRLRPEARDSRINLAEVSMQRGHFDEAAMQLEDAIRSGPSTQTARFEWFAGLAATGSVAEARKRYEESLRQQVSKTHDDLGTAFVSSGKAAAAIAEYRLAVSADPQSSFAALNLGLTLAGNKEPVEARRWLEQALRLDPELPAAHLVLGELLNSDGLHAEAAAHLKKAAASADPQIRSAAEKLLKSME